MIRPKILLAGGTDEVRDAMRVSLESENCDVASSGTVADGLNQILAQHFDVFVTDLREPQAGDHPTLLNAVRTFHPECLIVVVSDSLNIQEAEVAIRLQVDVILSPSNISEVAELLRTKVLGTKPRPFVGTEQWVAENNRRIARRVQRSLKPWTTPI